MARKNEKMTPNKYRESYEQRKEYLGTYDENMEHSEACDVESGKWVMVTRTVPVSEQCRPCLFGIYWAIPKQDRFDRQVCLIHTTEDVTLLNNEFSTVTEERLQMYREEGWELHETNASDVQAMNMELIEQGRALSEEERETIWALQLDGLNETQACEEYFLSKHTDYNNFSICYIPRKEIFEECVAIFGMR